MKRLLSGVQSTGNLHLGNYLGAIRNWVDLSNQGYEAFIFIADLHSITVPQDPQKLRHSVLSTAAMYIACGMMPENCSIFVQSSLPQHTELAWILSCFAQTGWMNRMTQFKDKSLKYKGNTSLGLYIYPILQAADILLYQPDFVPVGEDQKQHIELARDVAESFNNATKSSVFKIPEPMIMGQGFRIKSLRDGTKKMSKSDESDYSRINMCDDKDLIMKKLKKAKTDSIPEIYYDKENRPEVSNLLEIYSFISGRSIVSIVKSYSGSSMSVFKQDIGECIASDIAPINSEFQRLMKDHSYIISALSDGRAKAAKIATDTLEKTQKIIGLL